MKTRLIKPKRYSDMVSSQPIADRKIYPTLRLSLKDLPEAKDWEVGELYEIEMTVKQVSVHEDESGGEVTFEIRKVTVDDDEDEDIEESEEGEE